MSAPAYLYANITSAGSPATLPSARRLRRIIVGTGVTSGTVTVVNSASAAISIIDAASPGVYDFDIQVAGLIVTASSDTIDATVVYD